MPAKAKGVLNPVQRKEQGQLFHWQKELLRKKSTYMHRQ